MASKKEINQQLKIALQEIGKISPWYDKKVSAWVFEHDAYPVRYAGNSAKEVIKNYPLYLKDFIEERLNGNLSPITEKETKGRGGVREGAGRPRGTKKEPTARISLPVDIAKWMKHPASIMSVRHLMKSHRKHP